MRPASLRPLGGRGGASAIDGSHFGSWVEGGAALGKVVCFSIPVLALLQSFPIFAFIFGLTFDPCLNVI